MRTQEATDLTQDWLDRMAQTAFDGDFETCLALHHLPLLMTSPAGETLVKTPAMLRDVFMQWRNLVTVQHVTDLIRIVTQVEVRDDLTVAGTFTCEFLIRGQRMVPPHTSRVVLGRRDDRWAATEVHSTLPANYRYLIHSSQRPDTSSVSFTAPTSSGGETFR